MADGVETGAGKFRVTIERTEEHKHETLVVEMNKNQTFQRAIEKACNEYKWMSSDFKFEFASGHEVCITDTPDKFGLEKEVTIRMTRKVAYIDLDLHRINASNTIYSREGFTIKTRLSYTFEYAIQETLKTMNLSVHAYESKYMDGVNVSETDTPITKGMRHNEHIKISCIPRDTTGWVAPSGEPLWCSHPLVLQRQENKVSKTRSGREF